VNFTAIQHMLQVLSSKSLSFLLLFFLCRIDCWLFPLLVNLDRIPVSSHLACWGELEVLHPPARIAPRPARPLSERDPDCPPASLHSSPHPLRVPLTCLLHPPVPGPHGGGFTADRRQEYLRLPATGSSEVRRVLGLLGMTH
jgi:hypothetical protein